MGIITQKNISRWQLFAVVLGLLLAIIVIVQLNQRIVIDACLDYGGDYYPEQNTCFDHQSNYHHSLRPTPFMITGYVLLLLIIPFLLKRLVDAWFNRQRKDQSF